MLSWLLWILQRFQAISIVVQKHKYDATCSPQPSSVQPITGLHIMYSL